MNAIECDRLSRAFGRTQAVRELTLTVPAGSFFALLGPNGAGKTTALKLLLNLQRPDAGVSRVLGCDSTRLTAAHFRRIGYVAEGQDLPEWMTVAQLLAYCRPLYPTWDDALAARLLAMFDLPADRALKKLSRGMKMKAALLSNLAFRPELMVLDEPFSGLDPLVREELVHGLLEVSELGEWSVFISSHDIEEVERLADWIGVLEAGRLSFAESTDTLLARFRRIEVTLQGGPARFDAPPANWLELERKGDLVRFVETRYERDATERACRERFPEAAVTARPMTLREIFVTLARASRNLAKGAAA